jgi:hypothetical protein
MREPGALGQPSLVEYLDYLKKDSPDLPKWLVRESPIQGQERGFNERADAFNLQAMDGTDLNDFWDEVQATIRIRNADRTRLIDSLTFRVTQPIDSVMVPSEVDFEEASEYGQPKSIRGGFTRLWRGYTFKFWDLAVRYTWMYIAEADRRQLEMLHNMALDADNKLIFQRVMRALFNSLNETGVSDDNEPTTAYKFYNGDGEVPPTWTSFTHSGTHNHYLTSGGATVTSATLDTMADHLKHHGYSNARGYRLVLWANAQETAVIRTFKVTTGAAYDFVPDALGAEGKVLLPDGTYVGGPQGRVPGQIGTYGPFHVVEEAYIPAGYLAGIVTGGPDNLTNPIGLREHANPSYRGLKLIPGQRSQYPLIDSFYQRGIGTGIRQRGGGVVMQITASGTYTIPAAYV